MENSRVNSDLGIRVAFVLLLLGTEITGNGNAELGSLIQRHSEGLSWRLPVKGAHKSVARNAFEYGEESAIDSDEVDIEEDWEDYGTEDDQIEANLSAKLDQSKRNHFLQHPKTPTESFVPGCQDCTNSTKFTQKYLLQNDSQNFQGIGDISAGLKGILAESVNRTINSKQEKAENREYALYLFQGQYMVEPRLNRFIDGAVRNMVSEMKIDTMDPLFFTVLPRGQVVSRLNPKDRLHKNNAQLIRPVKRRRRRRPVRRRRPGGALTRVKIRVPKEVKRPNLGKNRKTAVGNKRQRGKQQRRRNQKNRRRRQNSGRGRSVGSGRVEGLSKITRDGDAEMQMFGNYTMIRSHQRIGPVVLNMQFRTKRGIRSTGASLPELKIHTVTRVSNSGSEMIDFVLDRPHAETISLRGKLFPLAERVAKNIFARLFQPGSFMVARIREKVGVSLLSKPRISNDGY